MKTVTRGEVPPAEVLMSCCFTLIGLIGFVALLVAVIWIVIKVIA